MFENEAHRLGLKHQIAFIGQLPARQAFAHGRILAIPSHAESFPYIVLEAAAAQFPLIATEVGGIPEMLPPDMLVPPHRPDMLANALRTRLEALDRAREKARLLAQDFRTRFNAQAMGDKVTSFYAEVMTRSGSTG